MPWSTEDKKSSGHCQGSHAPAVLLYLTAHTSSNPLKCPAFMLLQRILVQPSTRDVRVCGDPAFSQGSTPWGGEGRGGGRWGGRLSGQRNGLYINWPPIARPFGILFSHKWFFRLYGWVGRGFITPAPKAQ